MECNAVLAGIDLQQGAIAFKPDLLAGIGGRYRIIIVTVTDMR
jgi:hypothetical protein